MLPLRRLMSFTVRSLDAPLRAEQVSISLSSRFNRLPHPDARVEQLRDDTWAQLKAQNPRLFNANKFRLQGLHEQHNPPKLQLKFGLTDYATYVGICCSSELSQLLSDAALETRDGQMALIKRSKSVGLYQELYDTPGGHPEPKHLELTEDVLRTLEDKNQEDVRGRLEDAVKNEFFASIAQEVHEEVNLAPSQQQPPMLLGVVLQTDACTPSFSFHIKTQCSADELRDLYREGPADKFESVGLTLLSTESLLDGSTKLEELQLTPSAEGTLGLWKQHTLRARQ